MQEGDSINCGITIQWRVTKVWNDFQGYILSEKYKMQKNIYIQYAAIFYVTKKRKQNIYVSAYLYKGKNHRMGEWKRME